MARRMLTVKEMDFVDSVITKTEGSADNIALKSDVETEQTARENQDTILQNAIGGALRHQLVESANIDFEDTAWIDLGELNWNYDTSGTYPFFKANVPNIKQQEVNANKIICTIYNNYGAIAEGPFKQNPYNKIIRQTTSSSQIMVQDTAYTNANVFKNAMKGVLLAFEKAS